MKRRELLTTVLAGTVSGTLGIAGGETQTPATGTWPIQPLPFDPKKLKGLSEKLLVSHHENNNYAGAVRRIGQIQQMLAGSARQCAGISDQRIKDGRN